MSQEEPAIEFLTNLTNEATIGYYKENWDLWVAFVNKTEPCADREGEVDDIADWSDETFIGFMQYAEDTGIKQNVSSVVRHVYTANGFAKDDLPPSRAALIKEGLLEAKARPAIIVKRDPKRDNSQELDDLRKEVRELKEALKKKVAPSGPATLRGNAGKTGRTIAHSEVRVGDFVRIGDEIFQKHDTCYRGVDGNGIPDGSAWPFDYFRATDTCVQRLTFRDDLIEDFKQGIEAAWGGQQFNSTEEFLEHVVISVLGIDGKDDLIIKFGTPTKAVEEALDMLFGFEAG